MLDAEKLIADRARAIDASGIRRAFDLAASLTDPINLSIGQPDFDVPEPIREAAIEAIRSGQNKYTQTQGIAALRERVAGDLAAEFPETLGNGSGGLHDDLGVLITSGVSGGLMLTMLATVGPGDEVLIPDPYFVMYKHLVTLAGATPVFVDTYPDFRLTAERVEPMLTERTKLVLFNSPSNPTGVVATASECEALAKLCRERGVLLLSDEIYDAFCYQKEVLPGGEEVFASPCRSSRDVLLLRGFSKTYAMTGWRMGYAVGPRPIVEQMTKLQQYSFVCAPSMAQAAGVAALDIDVSPYVEAYRKKRDTVVETLSPHYELATPGGAFYAFPKVPEAMGIPASTFIEKAMEKNIIVIPGSVFSQRDTHFRLSYACDEAKLEAGLAALVSLAREG